METRNITITKNKAREWYNSENTTLRDIALQAFNREELEYKFKEITTFKKACEALNLHYDTILNVVSNIAQYSRASAAIFKLNIIRKALNLGQDLHLTKGPKDSYIWYPYNPFVTNDSTYHNGDIKSGLMEIIGKIKSEGTVYNVLGGYAYDGGIAGLGSFHSNYGMGDAYASVGFLGCASREIAEHFGKYFGMLITEAKYGDMVNFEIVSNY